MRPKADSAFESFKWGLSRFLDESRTLASFRHPNIVRVLRFFEANRTAYMVMEFVAGQPLGEWIRSAPAAGAERRAAASPDPLLDGLEVMHRAGYPAPRHQAQQHLHAGRRLARCCSTSAPRA